MCHTSQRRLLGFVMQITVTRQTLFSSNSYSTSSNYASTCHYQEIDDYQPVERFLPHAHWPLCAPKFIQRRCVYDIFLEILQVSCHVGIFKLTQRNGSNGRHNGSNARCDGSFILRKQIKTNELWKWLRDLSSQHCSKMNMWGIFVLNTRCVLEIMTDFVLKGVLNQDLEYK